MPATLDMLSPTYVQADRFVLTLHEASDPPLAFRPITINVDYSAADPGGINFPLELLVQPGGEQGGSARGYVRRVYRRHAPTTVTFTAPGAGLYFVLLREIHHNRWQGRLVLEVGGDAFGETIVRTRT